MTTSGQTRRRGRFGFVVGTVLAALMLAAVAYADNVANNLDTTIDGTAETMSLTVGGVSKTTVVYVLATTGAGDPESGCNLKNDASLSVNVSSSDPTKATVSPNQVTIDSCDLGNGKTITVTPVSAGSANITFSQAAFTGSNPQGTFVYNTATFTANVAAPADSTAPVGSVSIDGNAAYTTSTSVDLDLAATDAVGVTAFRVANGSDCSSASWQAVTSTTSFSHTVAHTLTSGDGSQTVCAQYKDAQGNVSATATDSIVLDTIAPLIQNAGVQSGTAGANGWYVSAIVNRFTATDGGSGLSAACSGSFPKDVSTGSAEGTGVTVSSGACSDLAGNTNAGISSAVFKIDLTDPSATLTASGTQGANGWFIGDVTVSTSGADLVSGPVSCTADRSQTTETTGEVFNGSCTNQAGLVGNAAPITVKLDKTAPSATLTASGTQGANGWFIGDVTVSTSGADLVSGPVSCTADRSQTTETPGEVFNGSCTNQAGLVGNAAPITVKLDKTNPSVAITSPVGGSSTIAASVTVSGTYSDAISGIATVKVNGASASLDSGSFSKMHALACGSNTITALGTDEAGRTSTDSTTVTRQCFGLQFFQPLDQSTSDPVMNKGKYGRVIPVKVRLSLAGGAALNDAALAANGWTLQIGVNGASCQSGAGTDDIEAYADAGQSAAGSNLFRWDPAAGQWIYNLDTKAPPGMTMTIGSCYRLDVYVSDGANKIVVSTSAYAVFQPTK